MKYILSITLSIILFISCSSGAGENQAGASSDGTQGSSTTETVHMSPQEFQAKIAELGNEQLVDVRTEGELKGGFIAGSTHMDYKSKDFKNKIASLNKEQPVMVYCASGGRSKRACEIFQKLGFTEIYELNNGFNGWDSAGLPSDK